MIYEVSLYDPTDKLSPPDRLLRISAVADLAFISIDDYESGNPDCKTHAVAQIAVSLPALRQALQLMRDDIEREAARESDEHGKRPELTGARHSVVPL